MERYLGIRHGDICTFFLFIAGETDGRSLPSTDAPKELLSLKEPYYELTRDAAILKAITRGVLPTLPRRIRKSADIQEIMGIGQLLLEEKIRSMFDEVHFGISVWSRW